MRNIIIGTAGHIDHGKTTLVKYLTGKDTDTLPDEKKRGMTIDLGFSYLDISENRRAGIIDVPGHEKFIKNMVAGVMGIDYIILAVACDDGIMPQTKEHFQIAELLGVKAGVIVLTKTDIADEERKKEAAEEIQNFVKGSFLENAPILETSVKDISSYEKLKNYIINDIKKIKTSETEDGNEFRMSIDRCFSVKGFGTVVTGTSLKGRISVGDTVNIYPLNIKTKVKGIENHGAKIESIDAGNRIALNLAGVEKSQIKRGDILSSAEKIQDSDRIDVMFTSLKDIHIKNNQRVRVHLGTREIIGRIRFFGRDKITEKDRYPAQILLEEKAAGIYGELGIIRNYSPVYTMGGIKILNISGEKTKRDNAEYTENLINLDKNKKHEREKNILTEEYLKEILKKFHNENSFERGILRAELKNRYFKNISMKDFKGFIEENIIKNEIKSEKIFEKEYISLKDFKIKLTKEQKLFKEDIFKKYKEYGFSPEDINKTAEYLSHIKAEIFKKIHSYLWEEGMIVFLGENTFILKGFLKEAEKQIKTYFEKNEKLTVKDFRELLKINRKSALLILEKLDNMEVTERNSDYRILKK